MYQLYHSKLPQKFYGSFCKFIKIYDYSTRNTKLLKCFIPRINKNFSKNLLSYRLTVLYYGVKQMLNLRVCSRFHLKKL